MNEEILKKLRDTHLDSGYWIPLITEKIGLRSSHALQYFDYEDYTELEAKIKYAWERKALRKLFNLPDSSTDLAETQQIHSKMLKVRNKHAAEILEILKGLNNEGKSQDDESVRQTEKELKKALQIPAEHLPPPGKRFADFIDSFQRQIDLIEESFLQKTNLSDEDILKLASGGLALEGIYITENRKDLLQKHEKLICVPQGFKLFGPEQGPVLWQREFESINKENNFQKSVEKLGLSLSCTIPGGFLDLGAEGNTNCSESGKASETLNEQIYVSVIRFNCVPLASCYFTKDQIRLSKEALQCLKGIDSKMIESNTDKETITNDCANFYKRFGSHVSLGPIQFGGILWWKASSEGFPAAQSQEAKKTISEALDGFVAATYYGWGANLDVASSKVPVSIYKSNISEFLKKICVMKTGGPPIIDSLQWKAGLVNNSKTWSVIDRGFQLMPVWEIILSNHKGDFKDCLTIAACLANSYKLLTNLPIETFYGECLLHDTDKSINVLEGMKLWTVDNATEHLMALLQYKHAVNQATNNSSSWIDLCLSDGDFQNFVMKVVEKYKSSPKNSMIKLLFRELLEPDIYSSENFPNKSFILKWIHDSKSNESEDISVSVFTDKVKKSKEDILGVLCNHHPNAEETHQARVRATIQINRALCSLLKFKRNINEFDAELLLLCTAHNSGFCLQNYAFQGILGVRDIEYMKDSIKAAYEKYTKLRKLSKQRSQAYVLLNALTHVGSNEQPLLKDKIKRLSFTKTYLGNSLSATINEILKKYSDNNLDFNSLEKDLTALVMSQNKTNEAKLNVDQVFHELEHIKQDKKHHKENVSEAKLQSTNNSDFKNLFQQLHLENYYPKKLNISDFRLICNIAHISPAFQFLHKLLMLDYRARYFKYSCKDKSEKLMTETPTKENVTDSEKNSFDNFLSFTKVQCNKLNTNTHPIHPMDIQMAILHCADDITRQFIYRKLSFCQFALPLLVPDPHTGDVEFPLWAFCDVQKKWQNKHKKSETKIKNSSQKYINEAEIPIVSFFRFGKSCTSKSQLINSLMSKRKHDIFYHRQCEGSTKTSVLMKGVAEIAWYCPGGRDDDMFDDCVAFTNLHGDLRENDKQVSFLLGIASVIVILLTEADMEDAKSREFLLKRYQSPKPLICLFSDKEHILSDTGNKVKIGTKNRNEAELLQELKITITSMIGNTERPRSLDDCVDLAKGYGITVDVESEIYKSTKEQVKMLMTFLREKKVVEMKREFLPLQGDLWHKWCQKDKELNSHKGNSNESIEQQRSKIELEKSEIRQNQLQRAFPLNKFITFFLNILQSHSDFSKVYFLQWFKMHLDKITVENLPQLNQKFHNLWSDIQKTKKEEKDKLSVEKMEKRLNILSKQINDSTFGLEHVLREVGQIYEASVTDSKDDKGFHLLPEIAANLMVSGYPVELMDGDAAHVPLRWIGAVLDKLVEILGNKKLFVLSVLGIQSTGKSTLLNAMFGLEFAVSAGRCTRGAFMQLVKVDEQLRQEMNFDFVLVIDTEGLRAMELSNETTLNHDNELATFVIGLGNITLINIYGKNPSEMQDILQIAVQAFLRMKSVNLKPGCLFVHQNVGEITAAEKNMEGQRRLHEKLDEMTRIAAEQEHSDITCFNDVIKFDVNTHILYFAHLWEGDPPMAPPNPSYSQNVQTLKKIILDHGKAQGNVLSISDFKVRVTDLWNALLNENFVFSFKNSLEIAAYNKLETQYCKWTWDMREHMVNLQNKLKNQILNNELQSIERISLHDSLKEIYTKIMEELSHFFTDEKEGNILIQWKAKTEFRLEGVKNNLIEEVKKNLDEQIHIKKSMRETDQMKEQYEVELLSKSRDLALCLKQQAPNKDEIEERFNKLWSDWMKRVKESRPILHPPDITVDMENIILEYFKQETDLINKISISYSWTDFYMGFSQYIKMKPKWLGLSFEKLRKTEEIEIIQETEELRNRINSYIDKKERDNMDYQCSYFHEILCIIEKELSTGLDPKFRFRKEFTVFVSLYLCRKAAKRFTHISDEFRKRNDPVSHFETKKNHFLKIFKNSFAEKASIASLAEI
uniref:VLIG-type G domain-containing protein n=1 Tax=Xenopus tropicalis TaxID=8364 RepID=A0A1B8Y109_XENTR